MESEQRVVHYRGRVQGVGFRQTTVGVAERFAVVGTVRNLPDGRVELVVEGAPDELDRFLAAVASAMPKYIAGLDVQVRPATNSFIDFQVRY